MEFMLAFNETNAEVAKKTDPEQSAAYWGGVERLRGRNRPSRNHG